MVDINSLEQYDIAIIGTGPAGLEAALTAKLRNKKIILLGDENFSTKINQTHGIDNYLGLPKVSGIEMQRAFKESLNSMDISVTDERIKTVYSMGKFFVLQGIHGQYKATTVIVSTGMEVVKTYPGEQENLGRGVSYCATCDGNFYRGRQVVVVAFSKNDKSDVKFLSEVAKDVICLDMFDGTLFGEDESSPANVQEIQCKNISGINAPDGVDSNDKFVVIADDKEYLGDGVFVLREFMAGDKLIPGIKMAGSVIDVNRKMETNIKGCFACGDVTGPPYQYIKAAGEGNVAALSAVEYLSKNN